MKPLKKVTYSVTQLSEIPVMYRPFYDCGGDLPAYSPDCKRFGCLDALHAAQLLGVSHLRDVAGSFTLISWVLS